jgi:inorganic phosphate transporter, PiT family
MNEIQFVIYCGVGIALFFDFVNGFHDSANSVATVIGTKVLKPIYAVGIAALDIFTVRELFFGLCLVLIFH